MCETGFPKEKKSMKMFIPEIGTNILLEKDWEFDLIEEHRNLSLFERFVPDLSPISYSFNYACMYDIVMTYGRSGVHKIEHLASYNTLEFSIKRYVESFFRYNFENGHPIENLVITIRDKTQQNYLIKVPHKKVFSEVINEGSKYEYNIEWDIDTEYWKFVIMVPKGTILKVDRIYIRKGAQEYSSITFISQNSPNVLLKPKSKLTSLEKKKYPKFSTPRFFAKLKDVNNIEFSLV